MEDAVVIENVWKSYGDITALRGVSFTVKRGEVFGLLGPNGAGKTTLLNIVAGLLKPDKGRVLVSGIDVAKNPDEAKKKLVLLPQEHGVYEILTGMENALFFATLYGISKKEAEKRALEAFKRFGLENFAKKLVRKYSGGMKRKLSLICALIVNPEIIVLDEPTTGLDPGARHEVWEIIKEMKKEGKTIILATHYMEEADFLCDRVAIMDRGEVKALDSPEKLKELLGPYSLIEVELAEATSEAEEVLKKLSETGELLKENNTVAIFSKKPEELLPEVISVLESRGIAVNRISLRKPTLEDVFLKLTGRRLRE